MAFDPYSINFDQIIQNESSGNPNAFNKSSGARGLAQVTPIALQDYNQMNPREQYNVDQLFDPQINQKVSYWYLTQRIPQLLTAVGVPVTEENIVKAYHDGVGNVKKGIIGPEGRGYVQKYNRVKVLQNRGR